MMQTLTPADKDYWKHIVASSNQLGIKLLPGFQGPGKAGNVVFSPTSIFVVLCLLYNGACGNSYVELATALGLPADKDLNPWMRQLINYINGHNPSEIDVQLSSALFFANGEHLHFDFANTLTESYSASLYSVDFHQSDASDRINAWAANATRGKISKLVEPFPVPPRFVIANTTYFLGKWVESFRAEATTMDDFYLPDGGARKVPMMSQAAPFHFFENEDCQSVLLPYQGGNYALQILLPRTMQSPMRLLPRIEEFARMASSVPPTMVELTIPKFKLDFGVFLQNALGSIGIRDLSDPLNCDLGRIGRDLVVSSIVHKAMIAVDETGTEAAAATAAILGNGALPFQTHTTMRVDHPFIFSICDTVTGQILFIGTLFVP
ncbi:MAG: serpin family protein [Cyanobacteria bacterium SZAS TMP-1]|nr:serpin family protein [Cyanobacteria bacterium SZAS TMP-1]